jgi:Zn-dependent M28 family amino/carboxypeptidase
MPDYSLLNQISRANLERDVKFLSTNWPTRHTLSKHHNAISEYLLSRFKQLGYAPKFHQYQHSGKMLRNIIATKPHSPKIQYFKRPGELILCGHFDSRQEDIGSPEKPAPGADDNATGVAVVLELARILKPIDLKIPIQFVLFSGEEQGEWGSNAYAKEIKKQDIPIQLVFNLDQIGYPSKTREVFVDRDEGGPKSNNAASAKVVDRIIELAKTIVKIPTKKHRTTSRSRRWESP